MAPPTSSRLSTNLSLRTTTRLARHGRTSKSIATAIPWRVCGIFATHITCGRRRSRNGSIVSREPYQGNIRVDAGGTAVAERQRGHWGGMEGRMLLSGCGMSLLFDTCCACKLVRERQRPPCLMILYCMLS